MKIRFKSWTLIFNFLLIGGGCYAPSLDKDVRKILITNGLIGIGLRAKTKKPLITKGEK